ncbi:MAG: electron transfer flavoprotein subunit alpha/FixB family protein [Proteobacteria bacterium]|nr:electron transfer flavoprotein subunit alpha/FixB family protein [Pseudomonadota bacterium]
MSSEQTNHNVWVMAEYREGELLEITLEMLGDARQLADKLKGQVEVLLLGHQVENLVTRLGQHGADRVYLAQHPLLERYLSDLYLPIVADLVRQYAPGIIILPATANGQDLASRLAARTGAPLVSDCVIFKLGPAGELEAVCPGFGDKVYVRVLLSGPLQIVTMRPGAAGVEKPKKTKTPEVVKIEPMLDPGRSRTRFLEYQPGDPRLIDLVEADRIVSGGRGVGGPEGFKIIEQLADLLGAAVGGTRVAVDNRWIPFERQVGQTGKTVAPKLYLAIGISGASHHIIGAKASETIVAINSDPNALIFKTAQLKVCADLHEVLPILVKKLEELAGKAQK